MAEAFLSLNAGERADVLRTVAARSGRAAIIVEKDIWVCWVLQAVFSMPDAYPMAFKGGTSLSKVYRIIDRFSEDVDVTLDYRGFNDGFNPFSAGASRNQIRLFGERLVHQCSYHKGLESQELSVREGASTRHSIRHSSRSFSPCPELFAEGAGLLTAAGRLPEVDLGRRWFFTAACWVDFITDREARSGRAVMRAASAIGRTRGRECRTSADLKARHLCLWTPGWPKPRQHVRLRRLIAPELGCPVASAHGSGHPLKPRGIMGGEMRVDARCTAVRAFFAITYGERMVEAAGVEPASEGPAPRESTCLSVLDCVASGVEGRRKPPEAEPR